MRLLHLSDLHLGKKLGEASLMDDQRHILAQILAVFDDQRPDAVLIAGDIYDKPVPSAEAVGLLDDFFTALASRGKPVIVISGNHDSAERLAFGGRLFTARGLYLSPVFDAAHAAVMPVRLLDEFGALTVWPLPFIKPAHVRAALPDVQADTYTQALSSVIAAMPLDKANRNVLVCHQFVTGATRSESEDVSVGGLDNVDASAFNAFDYTALGHLHRPQGVGRETVRYCGSPLKYSFSEAGDVKSVTVVDFAAKGNVTVRTMPLTPKRELRELRGLYAELTYREITAAPRPTITCTLPSPTKTISPTQSANCRRSTLTFSSWITTTREPGKTGYWNLRTRPSAACLRNCWRIFTCCRTTGLWTYSNSATRLRRWRRSGRDVYEAASAEGMRFWPLRGGNRTGYVAPGRKRVVPDYRRYGRGENHAV